MILKSDLFVVFQPITKIPVEIDRASCVVKDQVITMDYYEKIAMFVLLLNVNVSCLKLFTSLYSD